MIGSGIVQSDPLGFQLVHHVLQQFGQTGAGIGAYLSEQTACAHILRIDRAGDGDGGGGSDDEHGITNDGEPEHQRHARVAPLFGLDKPAVDAHLRQEILSLGDFLPVQAMWVSHGQHLPYV